MCSLLLYLKRIYCFNLTLGSNTQNNFYRLANYALVVGVLHKYILLLDISETDDRQLIMDMEMELFEVVLPQNKVWSEITEHYFYQSLPIQNRLANSFVCEPAAQSLLLLIHLHACFDLTRACFICWRCNEAYSNLEP